MQALDCHPLGYRGHPLLDKNVVFVSRGVSDNLVLLLFSLIKPMVLKYSILKSSMRSLAC
jgi:hypothetical protein